jgi:hypothetical protein
MTTRSTKRAANEGPPLSHIEALLIAQGVWEMGINSSTWSAIAKILAKHPLVTRPKSFFSAQVMLPLSNSSDVLMMFISSLVTPCTTTFCNKRVWRCKRLSRHLPSQLLNLLQN